MKFELSGVISLLFTASVLCRPCPPGTASASEFATSCSDCEPGSFSFWGFTACKQCTPNTYSDQPNAAGCSVCPTGKYANTAGSSACDSGPYCGAGFSTRLRHGYYDPLCLCPKEISTPQPYCIFDPEFYKEDSETLARKACPGQDSKFFMIDCIRLPCAPGSYLPADGDGPCAECSPGTYSKTTEASACRTCPAGTASMSAGATTCLDCLPGSYSTWGSAECYPCGRHTYTDRPGATSCAICPEGKYANSTGSTACDSGQYCGAGYRTEMSEYRSEPVCICPEGRTSPYLDLECAYDPEFYQEGTPDPTQCQPIPYFQIECIAECPPGSFYDYARGSCRECGPGTYSKTTGATACRPCPAGTASASAGASTCTDCRPGSYSTWGSVECSRCDRHTYSDHPKAVNCAICPTGKYAGSSGSTACNSGPYCKAGFRTEMTQLHGDPRPLCPESYVLQGEEPPCIYDPEFYIDGTPEQARREPIWYFQIECISEYLDCPAGTFSDLAHKRCSKCRAGKASARGAKKCSRCRSGSFSHPNPYSKVGASTCTVCPAGTASHPRRRDYSPTGSTGCKACRPGKYAPAGSKDCELCPRGKYAGGSGAVSCAACPTGKRAARAGSTACA